MLAYAIGNGPVSTVKVTAFDGPLRWDQMPDEIVHFHRRVVAGEAIWAAWNAGFDRAIWNYAANFPELPPDHIIDVMAQATASGLPADLARKPPRPSRSRPAQESHVGKQLIALFLLK